MNFIKTKNFKNMLNSFYDSVSVSNPTEFSNDADVDHGHNVISISGVTSNGKIYTCGNANEGHIWQFASDGLGAFVGIYKLVDDTLTNVTSDTFTPVGTINNIGAIRTNGVYSGFYDRVNQAWIGNSISRGLVFILCEDNSIDENKTSPTGRFKILTQVGTTTQNKGKSIYTMIDNENGVFNANSIMVLWSCADEQFSPVILGGALLNSPIATGNGVTFTVEIDWGLNPVT